MEKCLLTILKDDSELLKMICMKQADLFAIAQKHVKRGIQVWGTVNLCE
jgi:hypothetical protein